MEDVLYSVRGLNVRYATRSGDVHAVDDVSLDIKRGEILGLVGESGCGKSTFGKAIMRMIRTPGRIDSGELRFDGADLMTYSEKQMQSVRGGEIGMVFQDPMTSLNPVQRVVEHLTETIRTHDPKVSELAAIARAEELVEKLGIRRERLDDYPHQLSGGMRQRVMISLALALRTKLVIADEPTTSLDVIVEAKFLDLLRELRDEFELTILMITHNIGVVAEVADRVAVMYAGRMVEIGDVYGVFARPKHPYTVGLLNSVPNIDLAAHDLYKMEGTPPNLLSPPSGCPFHPRCPRVMDVCAVEIPVLQEVVPGQATACWLYDQVGVTGG
jgi:peptide/nickel transport system ATP-binding protein